MSSNFQRLREDTDFKRYYLTAKKPGQRSEFIGDWMKARTFCYDIRCSYSNLRRQLDVLWYDELKAAGHPLMEKKYVVAAAKAARRAKTESVWIDAAKEGERAHCAAEAEIAKGKAVHERFIAEVRKINMDKTINHMIASKRLLGDETCSIAYKAWKNVFMGNFDPTKTVAYKLQQDWRNANPHIVALWDRAECDCLGTTSNSKENSEQRLTAEAVKSIMSLVHIPEERYMRPAFFETKKFLNGLDISKLSNSDINANIVDEENKIKALQDIEHKTLATKREIAARTAAVAEVVAYLDSFDSPNVSSGYLDRAAPEGLVCQVPAGVRGGIMYT